MKASSQTGKQASVSSEQITVALGPASKCSTRNCTLMKTTILIGRQIVCHKQRVTHVQGILSPAPLTYWRTRGEKTKNTQHIPILFIKKIDNNDTNSHFFASVLQQILSTMKLPSNCIRVHVDGVCALTVLYISIYICMYVQHDTLLS